MTRSHNKQLLFLALATLLAAGCAKQEIVRKDEAIPSAAAAKPAETSSVKPSQKETGMGEPSIKASSVKSKAVEENAKALKGEAGSSADLEKIFFDFDSSTLTLTARETLASNAKRMGRKTGVVIRIEGHCDERGSDEYNLALGEKRARAAMQYLVTMGVPAEKLSLISYGREKPAAPGNDEAAWAKNRRDEFVITSK